MHYNFFFFLFSQFFKQYFFSFASKTPPIKKEEQDTLDLLTKKKIQRKSIKEKFLEIKIEKIERRKKREILKETKKKKEN